MKYIARDNYGYALSFTASGRSIQEVDDANADRFDSELEAREAILKAEEDATIEPAPETESNNKLRIRRKFTHPAELRSMWATFAEPIEIEVDAEQIGDVLVYQSPTSQHWHAENIATGKRVNNAERQKAIAEASF